MQKICTQNKCNELKNANIKMGMPMITRTKCSVSQILKDNYQNKENVKMYGCRTTVGIRG